MINPNNVVIIKRSMANSESELMLAQKVRRVVVPEYLLWSPIKIYLSCLNLANEIHKPDGYLAV